MSTPTEISELIADIKASSEYWGEMARIDFAQLLNDERHKQKMSQKQLAAKLGVSSAYIHKILAGESNCTLHNMARLMFALGKRLHFSCTLLEDRAEELARKPEEIAVSVHKLYRDNQDASRSDMLAE